jgi:uncharacterized protein
MLRRDILSGGIACLAFFVTPKTNGERLAEAAQKQVGVTTGYDPAYTRIAYPGGDVSRSTGVCADVVIRAARDGLSLDLQRSVHQDMVKDFAAYPNAWGTQRPDTNVDHRRVLNLEAFWHGAGAALWTASATVAGDAFPTPIQTGDLLTWMLDARLPHVGVVIGAGPSGTLVVHNIGGGVQQNELAGFRMQRAKGHYRWPA